MRVDTTPCEWRDVGGVRVPILGSKEKRLEAIANRLKGPSGESDKEWRKWWRIDHNEHYIRALIGLQKDRESPKNRVAGHGLLVGADLRRADLSGMNLGGLNLSNANLRGADLTGSDLTGATLIKCDFSRACLYQAVLDRADLTGADMSMCYMKAASFVGTRMWRVWLRHVMAESAIFFDADMTFSDFRYSDFWGARFDGAIMDDVAHLDKASFVRYLKLGGDYDWKLDPTEGYVPVVKNFTGSMTFQGNAARRIE